MGDIVLLDELTINKIAAGEVIERPASVVKEMLENSIDAGATKINIEIQNGGISKIRITDNGKGIAPDDMRIAFERHATSKIRVADDLETVRTMGFRGEALASIAAISKIEMVSRTIDNEVGNKIIVEGGKISSEEMIGSPLGTSITVENLFYNTPVRYKFLKKDYTEMGYIEDVVTRIALVNPHISIKLVNSGKTIIQTNGNDDMKSVIYSIFGKGIAEGILDVDYTYENIKVKGVVGKPEIARSTKSNQIFFVNKRYVKDKTLAAAADQAFRGMLTVGKFGFLILNIEMSPKKIDVNVHPAKLEIRFSDENTVFKAVMYAIKDGLLKRELIETTPHEAPVETLETKIEEGQQYEKPRKSLADILKKTSVLDKFIGDDNTDNAMEKIYDQKQSVENEKNINVKTEDLEKQDTKKQLEPSKEIQDAKEATQVIPTINKIAGSDILEGIKVKARKLSELSDDTKNNSTVDSVEEENNEYENIKEENIENKQEPVNKQDFEQMYEKTFGDIPASMKKKEVNFDKEIKIINNQSTLPIKENEKYKNYKYIGTAFSTYIIIEVADEFYIIDQHAAHERIMYEKVKANFYSDTQKDSQLMLLPDIITLTHKEISIAKENLDIFAKAGFVVEEFGENTLKLSGVPNICIDLDTKSLFLDILDEIDTVARTERQEIEEKFIATVACKSAVKANMTLNLAEIDELMKKLLELPNPFTCPHGRPTAIKIRKVDIEKKFGRR